MEGVEQSQGSENEMGGNLAVPTLQPDTETKQMFKIDRIDYS